MSWINYLCSYWISNDDTKVSARASQKLKISIWINRIYLRMQNGEWWHLAVTPDQSVDSDIICYFVTLTRNFCQKTVYTHIITDLGMPLSPEEVRDITLHHLSNIIESFPPSLILFLLWTECLHPLPQKIYIETLIFNRMVLEGWAFLRWLGYEGGAPMNRISALIRQDNGEMIAVSTMWGHNEKMVICNPEEGSFQNLTVLAPWHQISCFQNCEKQMSAVCKPLRLWCSVISAWTKTIFSVSASPAAILYVQHSVSLLCWWPLNSHREI